MPRQPRLDAPGSLLHVYDRTKDRGKNRPKYFMVDSGIGVTFRGTKERFGESQEDICQLRVGEMGNPGAEVTRFLGVMTSLINQIAVSKKTTNLTKSLKLF